MRELNLMKKQIEALPAANTNLDEFDYNGIYSIKFKIKSSTFTLFILLKKALIS